MHLLTRGGNTALPIMPYWVGPGLVRQPIRIASRHHEFLFQAEKINLEARNDVYQGHVAILTKAIYNGENWDKQTVATQFHMGDRNLDYMFRGEPSEKLEEGDFLDALDKLCERADF